MTKREAIRAMCDGKRIIHSRFPDSYFKMDGLCNVRGIGDYTDDYCDINHINYPNEGWEIYEEPVQESETDPVPKCCGNCKHWDVTIFNFTMVRGLTCQCTYIDCHGGYRYRADSCGNWKELEND
jgi:hypothetical protein